MKQIGFNTFLLTLLLVLNGCGDGGGGSALPIVPPVPEPDPSHPVSISGQVTYDLVPAKSDYVGLDYLNMRRESSKLVSVEAIDDVNNPISSTVTDANGHYSLEVPLNSQVKIRVYAKMIKTDQPVWNVKVVDNTNNNSVYVMEGAYSLADTDTSTRNLHAPSGWAGTSYTSTRVAAPFAMLDSVYYSMEKVLSAEPQAVFSPLLVNWSVNNKAASGDPANGDIGTSYYYDRNLFILGDEDSDTDEYDDHVIAHEWAHYYEDTFSRSDSVGGPHSDGEILDIRVALSEGWGNAFSAMALNAPVYFDTYGASQSNGFNFNVESEAKNNAGWYSEGSIQRILYDLFDSTNEGSDTINLGFAPIHKVFTGQEKTTPLFTSLFSFITYLKDENPAEETEIDNIVASEDIESITDITGSGRTNKASELPEYTDLVLGSDVSICPSYTYGTYNKLGNRKYIRFNISTAGSYSISIRKNNTVSGSTDPDFYLHNMSTHTIDAVGEDATADMETQSVNLAAGSYLLDVYDYESISSACFNVTVN